MSDTQDKTTEVERVKGKNRVSIPKRIEHEVLMRNQNVCCICQRTPIQIHHIDGNPANNSLQNLCVLCLEHHAQASSTSSMTKGLEPTLIRKYKRDWEEYLARKRKIYRPHSPKTSQVQALFEFEVKKYIYLLPTLNKKAQINKTIDYLYHWHLMENVVKYVIRELGLIHWFLDLIHVEVLCPRIYEFFWHFIDPKRVKMTKSSEKEIVSAIKLLGDIGIQSAILEWRLATVKSITSALSQLFEVGIEYDRRRITDEVQRQLQKMQDEWKDSVQSKKNKGAQTALSHIRRTLKRLKS